MAELTPFQGKILDRVVIELRSKTWYCCLSYRDRERVADRCYKALYHALRARPNPARISIREFVTEWGGE